MSGALNIGTRALTTNLAALQVIGHNIANVNTAGYSRQSVQLQTAGYQQLGSGYFGKGVEMGTVERSHDAYLTREARITSSLAAADGVRLSRLQQMETLFPLGAAGIGSAMNDMLNSWNDVASSPTNLSARVVVITRGEEFASRMRNTATQIDTLAHSTQLQIEGTVRVVNGLAKDLATVNQRIIETAGGAHTPNDLYDQRDQLLRELSQHVQISAVPAENGTMNVFVGGSQPLVLGQRAASLEATRDPADSTRLGVSFVQGSTKILMSDASLGGGELAGLVRFLNDDLRAVQNGLGRMALATATTVNQQHALGVDLRGDTGQAFFVPPPAVLGTIAQPYAGSGTVSASVTDPSALIASDYEVRFEGGGARVIRLSDGKPSDLQVPAPASFTVDGLTFSLGGAASDGDRFMVRPFEAAARDLQMAIGSPDRLAAASPVMVVPGTGNQPGLSVESLYAVSSPATAGQVAFLGDGSYTIDGGPSTPFIPGQPIVANGWSLTLRGSPSPGDTFNVEAPVPGSMTQNAGNAAAVLALRDRPTYEGVSLADGYIGLFADVGTRVQSAEFSAGFSAQVASAAESARANVAGVNLDEEAARLLQFQQSYQAAAKFMQIAQSTFDTLLQTVGR
ncbi:MAG: flagellar hook-associated protein FlgK [Hydrogenophaga sp.]|nr:flagellar hook-associated protein FlgK [Hydrogenophaga sp.]